MSATLARRPPGTTEETGLSGTKLLAVRALAYLTNHAISRIPSFALRRLFYRRVLGISLGSGSRVHLGCFIWFFGPNQVRRDGVRIGANSRINRDCCLDARGPLHIGDNVSISPEVMILTADHRYDLEGFALQSRPVVIEDNVWIGSRAMILPGTTVGRGAVVAAGAVVTKDVPAMAVVAGVPARVVRTRPVGSDDYILDDPFPLFE